MRRGVAALAVLALMPAGCGSSGGVQLTVSGAASLKRAFTEYGAMFHGARVRTQFGGSDILAAQIEQGARPDVFAAANTTIPLALLARHLVERPVRFAANRLVIAVPASSTKIRGIADLQKAGATIAIGSPAVPVGAYTRKVLRHLGAGAARILANVRTQEPDVGGIVGKLTQGAADAGFTYITDVRATHGRLRAIALPPRLQPVVAYAAAVVAGSRHPAQARAFIAGLVHGPGQRALIAAGFLPPP